MRLLAIFLACLQLCLLAAAVKEDEELFGWHEFHLTIQNDHTARVVRKFAESEDFLIANENNQGFAENVLVPPTKVGEFREFLERLSVKFDIPQKDMGGLLLKRKLENQRSQRAFNSDPSTFFAQTSQIYDWIDGIVRDNGDIASKKEIGTSYERRRIVVLELSTNKAANRPVMFIDAAIHAREWLAPATLNYIIKQLISDYKAGNAEAQALLTKFDWHFLPVVNPDGYDYTFRSSSTRFWRKTRQPYGFAYGADPNRNFDYMFGGAGTSNNPSSDIYHGPRAFSEPETKALSVYLSGLGQRLQNGMYISIHTYGQWWLTPPGYTRVNPSDHAEMMRVANIGMNAIRSTGGLTFRVGQPANVGLYEAAGGSYDWVKYRAGVKYSYTLELRPYYNGSLGGFAPSASEIPRSGQEIYAGVKAVANAL